MTDYNFIAYDFMTDFNGPGRHYPNPNYPAGVYDADSPKYKYGPESSVYPNLTLPCTLYDETGSSIPDGFYMVVLSNDRKFLELYQSNELKARARVVKLVEKMYTDEELREEDEIIARMQSAKQNKKLKKYEQAKEDLTALREKKASASSAEIVDSGKGYYILNYNAGGMKAEAYIQK